VLAGAAPCRQILAIDPFKRMLAVAFDRRDRRLPRAGLGDVRGGPQPAIPAVVGADRVLLAEVSDFRHRGIRGARQTQRLGAATRPLEPDEVMPERHGKPAVPAARA
jgi:hypothetical protein